MSINKIKRNGQRPIKGVLFDFDGTLTYPGALDFNAIRREMGCPEDRPILEYLETQEPVRRSELLKILESKEEKAAERSIPNKGAEKCLAVLLEKGLPLGILTRNSLRSVRVALERFNGIKIEDFSSIITREDSLPKPHPGGIYKAAGQMGILPSELMMVGDFRFDVMAGKAAGAFSVLLTSNGRSVMAPGDPEPDGIVDDLLEILKLI
ncbi:MAG: HAD family hydrolase [Deltaproteobacteria bacterium]|nr:HAD family hydrolase [Deltaproteobacteria bacterium]